MADTQHFVVSIDEGNSQGVYCAYCGNKIIPTKDETGSYYFQCDCSDAKTEKQLYEMKGKTEHDLEIFFRDKTGTMQINELRTRIVVYDQHIHELKKKLQELLNKAAGVAPQEGVSTLVVQLPPTKPLFEEALDLTEEVFFSDEDEDKAIIESNSEDFSLPEEDPDTGFDSPSSLGIAPFDMNEQGNLYEESDFSRLELIGVESSESLELPNMEGVDIEE